MTAGKKAAEEGHELRINALEDAIETVRNTVKAMETRLKTMQSSIDSVAAEKGEIQGQIIRLHEQIGSIRGSIGAAARHGGPGAKPVMPPLPPGIEITPEEQQLFTTWNWTQKQIQQYVDAKALMQTISPHIPAGPTPPAAETPRSSKRKGNDTS